MSQPDLRPLTDRVAVAPQLRPEDLPALAAAGVRRLVNNRPDGEAPGQPTAAEMAAAAAASGLTFVDLPLAPGGLTRALVDATGQALGGEGRVVAYCRSGTRSATLWALAEAAHGTRPLEDILEAAAEAGYDLSGSWPQMQALRAERGG